MKYINIIIKSFLFIFLINFILISTVRAESNNPSVLQLSLFPNHEDSSVKIDMDITKLNYRDYLSLGVFCAKENGLSDFELKNLAPSCGNTLNKVENRTYTTVVSNLKPDTEYEFCLNGIDINARSTGYFECKKIKTSSIKKPVALFYINYDVSSSTRNYIKRYKDTVLSNYPDINIVEYSPSQKISDKEMLNKLRAVYKSSNLKYLLMIGFDLPVPMTPESIYYADPYRHLSVDESIMTRDFVYTLNHEIGISVIRPENEKEMQNYFDRLYNFYTGQYKYDKKILIADSMIPAESSIKLSDVPVRYKNTIVDYVSGITKYHNPDDTIVIDWQNKYGNLLSKSHEITFINSHGSTQFHEPCRYNGSADNEQNCISGTFIKNAKPNSMFIVGISCNIGNFMTKNSPMNAYIFSGNSLSGISSETFLWDSNSQISKSILNKLSEGVMVGDISRVNNLVTIGDPFLRIDMPQNYNKTISAEGIKSIYPSSGAPGTKVTLTLSNPNKTPVSVGDFNFGPYGLVNFSNSNNEVITFTVPNDAKAGSYDVVWFGLSDMYIAKFNVISNTASNVYDLLYKFSSMYNNRMDLLSNLLNTIFKFYLN